MYDTATSAASNTRQCSSGVAVYMLRPKQDQVIPRHVADAWIKAIAAMLVSLGGKITVEQQKALSKFNLEEGSIRDISTTALFLASSQKTTKKAMSRASYRILCQPYAARH